MKKSSNSRFQSIHSHTLVTDFIPANAIVIDAGANLGEFSRAMVENYRCRCFAIEPSPAIFQKIPAGEHLHKFCFALAGAPGNVELHVSENSESTSLHKKESEKTTTAVRVPARTLEEFCATMQLSHVDVIKMDIEGEELAVFDSCSDSFLKKAGQITLEFHEWIGLGTVEDVKRIIGRMRKLGFYTLSANRTSYSDVLFINRRYMSRTGFALAWMNLWIPRFFQSLFRRLTVRPNES